MRRTLTRVGGCICVALFVSLFVGCSAWTRTSKSHRTTVERIDSAFKTDSTTRKYDVLVARTYAIVDTVSILKTETIRLSGIDRQVINDRYIKSVVRDTIYLERNNEGTIVAEPASSTSIGLWIAVALVVVGVWGFLLTNTH